MRSHVSFISRALVTGALTAILAAGAIAQDHRESRIPPRTEPGTLAVVNGKVMTMDDRYPRAEAFVADGEWIFAVGTMEEIRPFIGPNTRTIDAGGKLVVPGFNDSHTHFASGSARLRTLDLYEVPTLEDVRRRVAERVAQSRPGEWIIGSGYDHTLWGEAWPTRADLDRVAPNNPVRLTRASGHSIWVNSMAIRLSGVTRDTAAPEGGEIQKDAAGEPTGIFLESAAGLIGTGVESMTPAEARARKKEDLLAGMQFATRLGVTSVHTSTDLDELEIVREIQREGKLTLRWNGWLWLRDAPKLAAQGIRSGAGDRWVRVGHLKGYIDGTLGEGTAAMFEPFADRPDFTGLPRMTQEEADRAVATADALGFQIAIHAIGDRGVHMALNAYERAALQNGTRDMRHRIEHAQLIKPDDLRRFGRLGVIPSMQQTHCTTDMRFAEVRVGFERSKTAYPWRSLLDGGAVLAFGTDWAVEPLDPMRGVFSSVTRTNIQAMAPKTGWFPEQKLTVWESIYYYTWGSAHAEHQENVKGSIARGRLADFVVIDRDLFTVPTDEILEAKIEMTVVGGRIVWDRDGDNGRSRD
jgi:hypothetical protein